MPSSHFYNFITNRAEERNNGARDTSETTCSVATRYDRTEHPVHNWVFQLQRNRLLCAWDLPRSRSTSVYFSITLKQYVNMYKRYSQLEQCCTNCVFWFDAGDINASCQDQQN
uniref:Uncharacterized protein n=1 Tax=Glossina austeni TaxID=7395 RepID=A0A1A9V573_GLOAU